MKNMKAVSILALLFSLVASAAVIEPCPLLPSRELHLKAQLERVYRETKALWPNEMTPEKILAQVKSGQLELKGEDSDVIDRPQLNHRLIGPLDRNIVHSLRLFHKAAVMFVYVQHKGQLKLVGQQYFGKTFSARGLFVIGGHMKAGDTDWELTARREIIEELGLPEKHKLTGTLDPSVDFIQSRSDSSDQELIGVFHYVASPEESRMIMSEAERLAAKREGMNEAAFTQFLLQQQYESDGQRTGLGEIWDMYFFGLNDLPSLMGTSIAINEFGQTRALPVDRDLIHLLKQPAIFAKVTALLSR